MGYGETVAYQVETLLIRAEEGAFTEEHAREEAEHLWSTLDDTERTEAMQILNSRDIPNGR